MKKLRELAWGFSLTELMVVVVIIGVLAAIATPMYQKYLRKARTSEAVSNLGSIAMYEETYFSESDSYVSADANPTSVPTGVRLTFDSAIAGWSLLGRVIPHGSPLYFQYEVIAGQVNSDGTQTTGLTGRLQNLTYTGSANAGNGCGSGQPTKPSGSTLGLTATASTNWFFVRAMGNQRNDSANKCSMFVKVIDRTDIYSVNETD